MPILPQLYPPRSRSTNIELIKSLRAAYNEQEFNSADQQIAKNLHPSLIAELDFMEMSMPVQQKEDGIRLVDGLFFHHLPAFLSLRKAEFDLPDEELRMEVAANIDFYLHMQKDELQPLDALGPKLSQKLKGMLQTLEPDPGAILVDICDEERPRIIGQFEDVRDPNWLFLIVDVEIMNALYKSLDHLTSRFKTKQFFRHIGDEFPRLEGPTATTPDVLQLLSEQLAGLEREALRYDVYRLAAVCHVLRELYKGKDSSDYDQFSGTRAVGSGPCGNCSMYFASSAIVSYDPNCPDLFEGEEEQIHFPLDFNVSICPFCGESVRAETPSLFYSPARNLVIYNLPLLGQYSKEEARSIYRDAISYLREQYIQHSSPEEAVKFNQANEEMTYHMMDFLLAIQMGTTAREEHVCNLVRLADGSGLVLDNTKGAIISLTPIEMESQWSQSRGIDLDSALKDEGLGGDPKVKEAMQAFSAGEYERSREILEALYKQYPNDEVVRKNLAVAYVTLGDKESAKKIMQR